MELAHALLVRVEVLFELGDRPVAQLGGALEVLVTLGALGLAVGLVEPRP